tara:strand:+ start:463 stop:657 length:195 start_codon:yes stop_codon:yes gene_type:complete
MGKIGINWKFKWLELMQEYEMAEATIKRLERRLKKYEDNNIRSTRNRKNNNVVKLSRRIYSEWD